MKHRIYSLVDDMFEAFIRNNGTALRKMAVTRFRRVGQFHMGSRLVSLGVVYIVKAAGAEGPLYFFFDVEFEKVYRYYDAK